MPPKRAGPTKAAYDQLQAANDALKARLDTVQATCDKAVASLETRAQQMLRSSCSLSAR